MKSKLLSISLASKAMILFLIFASFTASVALTQGATPTIKETRITTSGYSHDPAIYGNIIVWQDKRNGIDDIYMYDLCSKRETRITNNGSASSPKIYGDKIVWDDSKNFNTYMYDLSTHKETQISTYGGISPAIYGDRIVYDAIRTSAFNICVYNISTHKETQITNCGEGENAEAPAIYGDRIVYQSYRNGKNDIYMYNLSTNKETQITTSGSTVGPKIYGDWILWDDTSNGWDKLNLYMYDLSTSKETKIAINASESVLSAIYGDRVVWKDTHHEEPFIRMYNISTGKITNITNGSSADELSIYGNRIVWRDYRHGGDDIYMVTLFYSPVVALSTSQLYGKKPLTVKFTDKSTGSPISWYWNFGDGVASTHPRTATHTYTKKGTYSVSLKVSNSAGSNTITKTKYITVN